jgi:hypothetical protein
MFQQCFSNAQFYCLSNSLVCSFCLSFTAHFLDCFEQKILSDAFARLLQIQLFADEEELLFFISSEFFKNREIFERSNIASDFSACRKFA